MSDAEPLLRTLSPALRELEQRLRTWLALKHPQPLNTLQKANLEGLAIDLGRQSETLQQDQPALVIMLMGGTGVGKSSLLNALAGGAIAQASFARPTTRDPVVYFHESIPSQKLDPALRLCKLTSHDRPALRYKILVDTPDIDSNDLANREKLLHLMPIADVVLYVGSQEKYHDKIGWDIFLQQRQRRAFAFVLNKWDRCQVTSSRGERPDVDWLADLKSEGFDDPLLFRTCAQHWIDHPWQTAPKPPAPPVEGEQFHDLLRWLELGLDRLEIEAIKAKGVGQLLKQLLQAMTDVCPPDLTAAAEKARSSWIALLAHEADEESEILLRTLDPYEREIERRFAEQRQKQFSGFMATYLRLFNRFRYGGVKFKLKVPWMPSVPSIGGGESQPREFDMLGVARSNTAEASGRNLDPRQKALANRLLLDAEQQGMPLRLLAESTERVSRWDWKTQYTQAMTDTMTEVEELWSQPRGSRRWMQATFIFLADWLPPATILTMGGILMWMYLYEHRSFEFTHLVMPVAAVFFVVLILHVLISIFMPLRWSGIRAEFRTNLRERLAKDLDQGYGPLPGKLAEELLADRRLVEEYRGEIDGVLAWLEKREQAASIAHLYGK